MTPEEKARYGPPTYDNKKLSKNQVLTAIKHYQSLAGAARKYGVSRDAFKAEMNRHGIAMPEKWEDGTMKDVKGAATTGEVVDISDRVNQKEGGEEITIIQALQLKAELIEDTKELAGLVEETVSPRIKALLIALDTTSHEKLVNIDKAFEATKIVI